MTTENFILQYRLIQTSQTGGQWYSDTSPFSIPWYNFKCKQFDMKTGSANASGRHPKSCLGQVFRIKIGSFAVLKEFVIQTHALV